MRRIRPILTAFALLVVVLLFSPGRVRTARSQSFSLVGNWTVRSQPINGVTVSRMGNTLGFPVRHMIFAEDGSIRTGEVDREDVGPNVKPLGVWRVEGSSLSASFELWCPDPTQPCGSVTMRGTFSDANTIDGTMTVFFETPDTTTPTGLDTWVFSFHGVQTGG